VTTDVVLSAIFKRQKVTFIELLVVVSTLGCIVGLLMPAAQTSCRRGPRRVPASAAPAVTGDDGPSIGPGASEAR
jgi:hypothetical protein